MDIEEIRAFLSIVQLGGFTRAAGTLHRSQPAISRRISLLERDLGAPLLERVRGTVALTEAGRAFLPHAEAVIAALKDGSEAVRAITDEAQGSLSLAMVGTLADTSIVALLRDFVRRAKAVRLELRTASSREVSALVRRGEATLGLRYFIDPSADLASRRVGTERLLVICAADHRLAGRKLRDARPLADARWVGFPVTRAQPESFGHVLQRRLAAAGLEAAEVTLIDSLTAQKRLVEAGFGIALMPASSVREELRLGALRTIDVPALRTEVPIVVLHRRAGYLSAAARALLAAIVGAAPRVTPVRRAPSARRQSRA
jgi:DNA-binding transcriptional LysR family regulator